MTILPHDDKIPSPFNVTLFMNDLLKGNYKKNALILKQKVRKNRKRGFFTPAVLLLYLELVLRPL
jgi:hypothetical protein